MTLSEKISEDMKGAMKAKNDATLSTLRLLRSALMNKKIDVGHDLSDTEVQDVIRVQVKQLKDAILSFETGDRADMAESNKIELELLKTYLPTEMPDEELQAIVKQAVTDSGATSKADMGKAMGFVMKAVAGRADGTRVKAIVESLLGVFAFVFVTSLIAAHPAHASIGYVDVPLHGSIDMIPYLETSLKMIRVIFLWAGVFCINDIIHGSLKMTTDASRDDEHHHAEHKIIHGFFGTGIVIALFCVTTVMIQKIS